jgi:hypothetical protein
VAALTDGVLLSIFSRKRGLHDKLTSTLVIQRGG